LSLVISGISGYLPHYTAFFYGGQPVEDTQPQIVSVNDVEPGSLNWDQREQVTAATNLAQPVNPAFVGNQPVSFQAPEEVQINSIEAPTANWPPPANYPPDPPPENPG